MFGLVVDDLTTRGMTPSLNLLILNMGRVPEVFDSNYPGYRASGLASQVLLRLCK